MENFEEYSIIFLGYLTWGRNSPKIMSTFVESYNFNGKTVIPFATSISSKSSSKDLEEIAANVKWRDVQRFPSAVSEAEIEKWVKSLGMR